MKTITNPPARAEDGKWKMDDGAPLCISHDPRSSIFYPLSVLALALFFAATPANAQKVGTTSLQFLKVEPTARATSLGSSYAALAEGPDAIFWNPAGLAGVGGHALVLDRVEWLMDTAHNALAYGGNFGSLGYVGLHVYMTDIGSISETSVDALGFKEDAGGNTVYNGFTGATFEPRSWVVGLTYARQFTDRFSAGMTAKYAQEDLYRAKAGVPLFDFGIKYFTGFRSLRLGASVMNFGPDVEFEAAGGAPSTDVDAGDAVEPSDSYAAPMTFRIGFAADVLGNDALIPLAGRTNRVTVTYDLIQPNDYDQQWSAGLEYMFLERFALRGGYQHNFDTQSFSLGAGVRQPIGSLQIGIDYAYSDMSEAFQPVHRFSVAIGFE